MSENEFELNRTNHAIMLFVYKGTCTKRLLNPLDSDSFFSLSPDDAVDTQEQGTNDNCLGTRRS